MNEDLYLIQKESLQDLANLIKTKSNIDTSIPVSFKILGSKLESLENGIYKQITEGIFTETETSLNIQILRPYMFYKSQGLNKLELTNSNLILAPGVFKDSTITELVLGGLDSSVTSIPEEFFRNSSITSVYIPQAEQIKEIGAWAFNDIAVTNWSDFISITNIGDYAFYRGRLENFPRLIEVETIGNRAFQSAKIYSGALQNQNNIYLGNIQTIGDYAFDHCYIFKNAQNEPGSFVLNGQDIEIGKEAFKSFECSDFIIESSTFKSIGSNAFRSCNAERLWYDDLCYDPERFYKFANLDLVSTASSIFSVSYNYFPSYGNDWIWHSNQFYSNHSEITEIIFKPYTFQNFYRKSHTLFTEDDYVQTINFSFIETEGYDITKEIQKYAFHYATLDDIYLSGIETIGEKAFCYTLLTDMIGSQTKVIQLGSLGKPVKNIALNAFENLRSNTRIDEETGDEVFAMQELIINVYYDNRDYSKIGYPSDYMYGEDGKPLTTEDAPLWGISGDLAGITTLIWNEAFPDEAE